jgi:MFS family permease
MVSPLRIHRSPGRPRLFKAYVLSVMTNALLQARRSFFGWRIVALMQGPRAAGTGTFILGGTLFVIPLEESLGIQRGVSSLLFASASVVTGFSATISGAFMDRYGPRRILLISVLVGAAGYALFATSVNLAMVFIFYAGVIGSVILNVAFNASTTFVNNWFDRYKATAMSLLQVGSGIGALLLVPSMAFAIDAWGWRAAALVAAGAILVLGLPAAFFSRDTPEELGLLPDGAPPRTRGEGNIPGLGLTSREALRTPNFWLLASGAMAFGGAQAGLQIHFVPIMVWKGMDEVQGALFLTVLAFASTPTVLVTGWLADRIGRMGVAAGLSLTVAGGVVLLNLGSPTWTIWLAVLLIAPNSGMYPLVWATLGDAVGRRSFSTIRGLVMTFQIAGTFGVPITLGVLFEASGGYGSSLWVVVALWGVAGLLQIATALHVRAPGPSPHA